MIKAGEANYVKTFSSDRNRWGDYNGIALDPVDGRRFWIFAEYSAAPRNTWGTWFGEVTYMPVPGKRVSFEPEAIQFQTYEVGQISDAVEIVVSNIGTEELTISYLGNTTSSFTITDLPQIPVTLSTFQDIKFYVKFTPQLPGALSDSIIIQTNDINNPIATINLSGFALGAAVFRGVVKDSSLNLPIKAKLTFVRQGEANPRAVVTTDANGFFSTEILEGIYDILIVPEVPYPEIQFTDFVHTLAGTIQDLLLLPAPIVIVEDDTNGSSGEVLRHELSELGISYALWNMNENHTPVSSARLKLLADPGIMLWTTGATTDDVLNQRDRLAIIDHLLEGRSLILTGDNIAETSTANDSLLTNYLGIEFDNNFSGLLMKGFSNDPIGKGLITGAAGESKDQLRLVTKPLATVNKVFSYGITPIDSFRIAAVRAQDDVLGWKAVFFGFRLEEMTQKNRKTVIERTIDWLAASPTHITEKNSMQVPLTYRLEQNFPNPFNPTTTIIYELPQFTRAVLKVYNLVGQEIVTLVNQKQAPGRYHVLFDARDLPNGVYIYQLSTEKSVQIKKLILLK